MKGRRTASVPLISGVAIKAETGCPPASEPINVFAGEFDTFALREAAMELFSAADLHGNDNSTRGKRLGAAPRR